MSSENNKSIRLAIFASGAGTNAEAIMHFFKDHQMVTVALLLSNNPQAGALQRAKNFGVSTRVFTKSEFHESDLVIHWLREALITHVVLAGFLWLVPPSLIRAFPGHIVNIHPSLLPKFSGKGMYGANVHAAVKSSGELETGISIHVVNEHYDEGEILFQTSCTLDANDTQEHIADKVHELEYRYYPVEIEKWVLGEGPSGGVLTRRTRR